MTSVAKWKRRIVLCLGLPVFLSVQGCLLPPPPFIDVVDDHGYRHHGYYDDHHDWHGGYDDEGHNHHDDPHDWHR